MRNAFLVSDDDLKSLRNGEPWSIELQGQAVFLHENVLRLLMAAGAQPTSPTSVNGGAYDAKGRSLTCDQPACPRSIADRAFVHYAARQMHRSQAHGIPGEFADKHKLYPRKTPKALLSSGSALPIPLRPDMAGYIKNHNPDSYKYMEFDAKGICGIGDCPYKDKKVKTLHFHRSVVHKIRGINWERHSHKKARRKVGRPRKVKVA